MRKHNKKFSTRMGSARVDPCVPSQAHYVMNSKPFQLGANALLSGMLRSVK